MSVALEGGVTDRSQAWGFVRWYAAPGRLLRGDGLQDHCWVHARGHAVADLEIIHTDLPASWVG
ncbi:hypothetical protein [Streptomyces sp. NPDC058751]|uniref:hypothetical protein n=1 Tax=Streptomyces sp. NPDC058751 TaxID=3346623 RepID=UPI003674D59E